MGIIKENTLYLCNYCGGTGVDVNDKRNFCPACKGLKVLNRFKIEAEFSIPYRNEETRYAHEMSMETEITDVIAKMIPIERRMR